MADDRLWLKCTCGESFLLGKFLEEWHLAAGDREQPAAFARNLGEFLRKHSDCPKDNYGRPHYGLGSTHPFILAYQENEPLDDKS